MSNESQNDNASARVEPWQQSSTFDDRIAAILNDRDVSYDHTICVLCNALSMEEADFRLWIKKAAAVYKETGQPSDFTDQIDLDKVDNADYQPLLRSTLACMYNIGLFAEDKGMRQYSLKALLGEAHVS